MSQRGRGGKGGGRTTRGNARAVPPTPATTDSEPDIDISQHPAAIILGSHVPPKLIRFSIKKLLFDNFPPAVYDALPDRMFGEIERCHSRTDGKYSIDWEADNSNTMQSLAVMLKLIYDFRF